MKIIGLKANHRTEPLGIDETPVFSWNIETDKKNWYQKAYRILVSESIDDLNQNRGTMWDSGEVRSNYMACIRYDGKEFKSGTRYYWKVSVWDNYNRFAESRPSFFETGLLSETDWHGIWIGETEDRVHHIYRKTFVVDKRVKKARLYVCGLGHYEFYINGSKVGDAVLEPGWTNYNRTCLYSCYDITENLVRGENAAGVILGDGMFNVPGGRYVYFPRSYGKSKFLVQMNIEYEDRTIQQVVSDESWRMAPSPIKFCCIYGGEDYDARLEQPGFSDPGFIETPGWIPAVRVEPPKGRLAAQSTEQIKVMEKYRPVEVKQAAPGKYLYDLGTNFSGWVRIGIKNNTGAPGNVITMVPGEILTKEGLPDQRVTGMGYHWQYITNSSLRQSYAPRFTYYGFRYVLVTGAVPLEYASENEPGPVIESLVGEFVYPCVEKNGEFECSNLLFNQIHRIIIQAVKSNMKSIFTDCPHREKLGWLEQTHLIGPAVFYNFDVASLYKKIQNDMADSQYENGLVPDICPEYIVFGYHQGFVDSPEWGSACIINPWYIYKRTGDTSLFAKYYDMMKRYMDYLASRTHHHVLHHGLGDWLDIGPNPPYSQNTPVPITATAIYYYDLKIMAEVAGLLGKADDEAEFRKRMELVYNEYNLQFFDDQTNRYATGSQAAQAISLVTGLVDEKNRGKVLEHLVKDITARGFSTTAGDIGHPFVIAALMTGGRSDIINEMTNITDKPGYGYQVMHGATSLAENWDGPNKENPRGSQNHFMLGSVEEWFYAGLAGLMSIRTDNPFDRILIKPHFAKGCNEVKAWTRHVYGIVRIHWKRTEDCITVELDIPPNITAEFVSEIDNSRRLLGSGHYKIQLSG